MTIVSHAHKMIFLKTRKTAGSSIEVSLVRYLGRRDWIATVRDAEPLPQYPWCTMNATRWPIPRERAAKGAIRRNTRRLPALHLRQHSPAAEVRALVGERVWTSYLKVAVERDPWDRLLSLWRWRSKDAECTLDEYLTVLESGDPDLQERFHATYWSNWPMYAIGDEVVADVVVRYERLATEFFPLLRSVGIPHDGELPRLKSGFRRSGDLPHTLTDGQIARIADLYQREIAAFGYTVPSSTAG